MNELVNGFRAGLARSELLIQRCHECGNLQMYPRYRCTACQSGQVEFMVASGRGLLMSHTVIRAVPPKGFEADLPYGLGVVRLEEGVQLLGRLEPGPEGNWSHYSCDAAVTFSAAPAAEIEKRPVAWFRPDLRTIDRPEAR